MQKRTVLFRPALAALGVALACSALALLSGCTRPEAEVTPPSKADAPKQASKDDAKAEVNPHPIADVRVDGDKRALTCVVNGKPVRLVFDTDVPEDERDPFSADFALADVTGDGVDELLVRQYVWGNTYSETWSTGYVYEAKDGELKEVLRIPPEGFGRWQPKYLNNLGICPGPGGTLAIEAGTDKEDGELDAKSFLLTLQGGEWTVKDAPKGFECSGAEPAPAGALAKAMSDEDFFKLCEKGRAEQVKQALADGANPNAKDGDATVLEWAALNDNLPAVQALLDAGANPNREPPVVQTALMFAALADNPAMVQALLKAGANPNAKTASGHTALTFWARRHGNLMLDVQQMPPGHAQVVKALLAAGADVNGACSDDTERQCLVPLDLEVEVGCDPATVQALLDGGAGKRGRELEQALMLAAWRCAPQGLDVLLKAGASPNTKVEDGETALMRAARFAKPGNVAALLKAGADASAKDKEGHDALWHARHPEVTAGVSEADQAETVRLLQGGGAKKPAAQDVGDFSAADLKRMSTFVSEVTEVFPWDFDMRKKDGDRPDLNYFGVAHNFIHNRASRVKPCPKKGCNYGNAVMEAKFVAETARKYFDLEVKHHSTTDSDSPAPVHFDGRLYHFDTNEFIDDESPAVYYAEVTRAVREGGVIRMTGNIYEGRNAGEPPRITDFFVVTAKPHKWNGEDTWAILSLMTEDR